MAKNRYLGYLYLIGVVGFLIVLGSCARVGSPTGGDKDEEPPKVLKMYPELETINFNFSKIRIYFDEYIRLKDLQKQLITSPPLYPTPEFYPQGTPSKKLEIKITDTLQPNTTYVFNMGSSIVDNNEGNALKNFKYVFSTGSYIDTLTLSGKVSNAMLKEIKQPISVQLYEVRDTLFKDSIIYKKKPLYVTNLDTLQQFKFEYLKPGNYRIIALQEKGVNYLFNSKTERIGFLKDTIKLSATTTNTISKPIRIFKEIPEFSFKRPFLATKNKITFGYEGRLPKDYSIRLLSKISDTIKTRLYKDINKDSLHYWVTPFDVDSLLFETSFRKKIDTFNVRIKKLYSDTLVLTPNQKSSLSLKDTLFLSSSTPIKTIDNKQILMVDKSNNALTLKTQLDSIKNRLYLNFEVIPDAYYKIIFLPGAVSDMFGMKNDTIRIGLKAKSRSDYGFLDLKIQNVPSYPIILQLLNNNLVVEEFYLKEPLDSYFFEYLDPGDYFVRIVLDDNRNRRWDTGNYLKSLYPEEIIYFKNAIQIQANWDVEQTLVYNKKDSIDLE